MIYVFGSFVNGGLFSQSDVDIVLLLPFEIFEIKEELMMTSLHFELEQYFKRDVDLINLRIVSTVFQNMVVVQNGG